MATGFDQSGVGFDQSGISMDGAATYNIALTITGASSVTSVVTVDQTDSVSLAGASSVTFVVTLDQTDSVTLAGIAYTTLAGGTDQTDSVSLTGIAYHDSTITLDQTDSISLAGIAYADLVVIGSQSDSISLAGLAYTDLVTTCDFVASVSLPGVAYADVSSGSAQSDSITLAGVANFLPSIVSEVWVEGFTGEFGTNISKLSYIEFGIIPLVAPPSGGPTGYDKSLSIVGTATISVADNMVELTVSGAATVSVTSVYGISNSVSLTAASSVILVAGYVLENTLNPTASAFVDLLPGYGYDVTDLTVTGAATFTELDELLYGNVADTVGAASVAFTTVVDPGNFAGADAGTATAAVTNDLIAENSLTIAAVAAFYPENIFDIIPSQAVAAASIAVVHDFAANPVFNVQGQATLSVQPVGSITVSVSDILALSEVLGVTRPIINVVQNLGFVEQISKTKISYQQVTQTFVPAQQAFRIYPVYQTFALAQIVAPKKVISVSVAQVLSLSQVPGRSFIKPVSVVQTLQLLQIRTTFTQLGVVLQIPGAVATPIRQKCHFVLQAPARAIVLPCPVFGDGENNNGQVLIKRTVTGDRYSYVKKSDTRRLQYSFSVGTAKRYELLDFLYNYSDQLMTINNHKGEVWRVYLTNNPLTATSVGRYENDRENFNVTLEFEGLRVS